MENKMVRQHLDTGISMRYMTGKPLNKKCFEVRKAKWFSDFNKAQRFYKYILLEVTEKAYMHKRNGRYCVEFKTYAETYNEAVMVRDAVKPHFDLWRGGGLDV